METDAVGTEVGETVDGVDGVEGRPGLMAERIASRVADGPEAEGEVVFRSWFQGFGHRNGSFDSRMVQRIDRAALDTTILLRNLPAAPRWSADDRSSDAST